jgi:hypothetical protein
MLVGMLVRGMCWAADKIWSLSGYVGQTEKFGHFQGMLGSWKNLITFGVCWAAGKI